MKINTLCPREQILNSVGMSRPRLVALLLALLTLVVYLPVTRHGFLTYDDDEYITENPVVPAGLTAAGVRWAFTTGCASNWHPLTWLSHLTDCTLFGLNPGAHHFVNVLFHAANTALLFILLRRLTRKLWPSAMVAALFAWHPLHVESVAWIAERKDVLSTCFALLTLLNYAEFVQQNSRRHFWLAFVCFALGLMAKPMLVTLPFVMLLLDFWPLARIPDAKSPMQNFKVLLREKTPFFLLTMASCVVTFLVQHSGRAVATLADVPLGFRLENATVATALYLQKIFWPAPLAVVYPLAPIPLTTVVWSATVLVLISALAWRARHRHRCWLVGWLWFLGTLVPVIGIVQVGSAAMADRYTYIPAIGIFLAVVFGLAELSEKWSGLKKILPATAAGLLVVCIGATEWQLRYWRNTETLFRHALAVTSANAMAHLNLAIALELQGRSEEALAEYRETLRFSPDRQELHFNLGCLLGRLDRHDEALAEFRAAIRHNPNVARWHCAVGSELATLGQSDAALQAFAEAEQLKPKFAQPHLEAAKLLFQLGRDREAVAELQAAVQAEPDQFQTLATAARYLAANDQADARDSRLALTLATQADALSGHFQPLVLDVLAMAYADNGDFTNALISAQAALELAETAQLKSAEAIHRRLELYKNRQPWRESFRATNAPSEP